MTATTHHKLLNRMSVAPNFGIGDDLPSVPVKGRDTLRKLHSYMAGKGEPVRNKRHRAYQLWLKCRAGAIPKTSQVFVRADNKIAFAEFDRQQAILDSKN